MEDNPDQNNGEIPIKDQFFNPPPSNKRPQPPKEQREQEEMESEHNTKNEEGQNTQKIKRENPCRSDGFIGGH